MEAVQHIGELSDMDAQLEEQLLSLRIENMKLRIERARVPGPSPQSLDLIAEAAEVTDLMGELAHAEERLRVLQARPRPVREEREPRSSSPDVDNGAIFTMSMESPPSSTEKKTVRYGSSKSEGGAPLVFDSLLNVAQLALQELPDKS